MEKLRFPLLALVALLGFLLFQAWQMDHRDTTHRQAGNQQPATEKNTSVADQSGSNTVNRPQAGGSESGSQAQTGLQPREGSKTSTRPTGNVPASELIKVVTGKYHIEINTHGGNLYRVTLRQVPVSSEKPKTELTLIQPGSASFFRNKTQILSEQSTRSKPRIFHADKPVYKLDKADKRLEVPLVWQGPNGRKITKTYVFRADSYRIDVNTVVKNAAQKAWPVSNYVRFWRNGGSKRTNAWFIPSTFTGVGWYAAGHDESGYSYHKRNLSALDKNPVDLTQTGGWTAVLEHYFIAAAIPNKKTSVRLFAKSRPTDAAAKAFVTGFRTAQVKLAPGASTRFDTRLFIGPKLQDQMASTASSLDLTVDYGIMTVLARPIFHLLSFLHSLVGNWGVAIILLTLIIKLLFFKLSEKQYRAMARMRRFQPRIQQLKEQYGDDRQQLQTKMMELYKKEGFNPLAGCWPMLVQAPVFIVLYWVILQSAELRSAPFFLWIQDLSSPDPYYILPIYFGVTMFIQQRLTMTAAMDQMQQRLMQIMPIGLAIFFTFFPAGLVLYWCTNNTLSIAQQWYIYKKLDAEGLGH